MFQNVVTVRTSHRVKPLTVGCALASGPVMYNRNAKDYPHSFLHEQGRPS
jgi:hypothetical protein